MALTIIYCQGCGDRVDPKKVDAGEAKVHREAYYCEKCRGDLSITSDGDGRHAAAAAEAIARARANPTETGRRRTRRGTGERGTGRRGARRASGPVGDLSDLPRTDTRSRRAATASGGGPPATLWIAVGVLALGLVVGGYVLATQGDGPRTVVDAPAAVGSAGSGSAETAGSGSAGTPSGSGSGSATAPADPLLGELARIEEAIAARPGLFRDQLEDLRRLRERARSSSLRDRVDRLIARREADRDRTAIARFERLSGEADDLVEQGKFVEALAVWDRFGDQLRTTEWDEQIREQRRAIEARQADAAKRPDVQLVERPAGVPGGGRLVPLLVDGAPHRWLALPRQQRAFTVSGGMLKANNTGTYDAMAFAIDAGDKSFRDFYVDLEFRVMKNAMRLHLRQPMTDDLGDKEAMVLTVQPQKAAGIGVWTRMQLHVHGGTVDVYHGETKQSARVAAAHGSIALLAKPGDQFEIRNARLYVFGEGTALTGGLLPRGKDVPPLDAPGAGSGAGSGLPAAHTGALFALLDKGLGDWKGSNYEKWTLSDGLLRGSCPAGAKGAWIHHAVGDAKWVDYTIRFEIRNVVKALDVLVRWSGELQNTLRVPPTPDGEWHKVRVTVRGGRGAIQLNDRVTGFATRSAIGGIGFGIPSGASFELRKLTVTR